MTQHPDHPSLDNTKLVTGASTVSRRVRRRAFVFSILFHSALLIALLFWYLPHRGVDDSPAVEHGSSGGGKDVAQQRYSIPPVSNPEVPADQMDASVQSMLDQINDLPDDQKLSELEKNLKRLNSISNAESVSQASQTIAKTLSLAPGAVPRSESPSGIFDSETAQIHDVIRERDGDTGWSYKSVLVDSAGRTQTVAMPPGEGETSYNTFQQLKNYPMAEGIYRQLVMAMLQKMIGAMDVAKQEALRSQRTRPDQDSDRAVEPTSGAPADDEDGSAAKP